MFRDLYGESFRGCARTLSFSNVFFFIMGCASPVVSRKAKGMRWEQKDEGRENEQMEALSEHMHTAGRSWACAFVHKRFGLMREERARGNDWVVA